MMSRAMRVMVEKVPESMVSMPRVSSARCDAGTIQRYQIRRKGMATKEGTSHFTLHLTRLVLSSGCLSPSMRLAVMSAQMPASDAADAGAQKEAGPVSGIEEGVPEFAGLVAGSGDGEPGIAGREHEGENAVDDDERADGGAGIDPANLEVQLLVDAVPSVVIDGGGGEFDHEEDPLHGPAEDEVVNQRAGGFRVSESDGEPDAHAGDGAKDARSGSGRTSSGGRVG